MVTIQSVTTTTWYRLYSALVSLWMG